MSLEVLPDGGELFRQWALTVPELAELVGARIGIRLATSAPAIRYSVVSDAGSYGEGEPLVQVECWGAGANAEDDGTASATARTVAAAAEAAARALDAPFYPVVSDGPYAADDATTHRPRWILTLRLLTFAS